jgi:hypothetical protein
MTGDAWVLRDDQDELAAFVHVHEGSMATWLRLFIHPNAEADAGEIVKAAFRTEKIRSKRSVYCCVRRYEGWLPEALEMAGFRIWRSQAVLVKRTIHHSKNAIPEPSVNPENRGMPVTTPYVRRYPIQENPESVSASQDEGGRRAAEQRLTPVRVN